LDRHRLHRRAFGAFDAPHFMHIFLFNIRLSDSGNFAIGHCPLWCTWNKHIIFKDTEIAVPGIMVQKPTVSLLTF